MKYSRPILIVLTALLGMIIFKLHADTRIVFLEPVRTEFGWTRAQIAWGFPLSALTMIPFLLVAGIVYDWRGGRIVIIVGSIVAALGGYGLSIMQSHIQFAIWNCVFSAGGALFGGIVPLVMLANWFVRLRGIFIGLAIAVASTGTLVGTPLVQFLIDSIGWRTSYLVLGLLPLALIPLALFIKRRPEDVDSTPDFNMVSDRATLLGQWSALATRRYHPSYDAQSPMTGFKAYPLSYGKNKGTALVSLAVFLFLVITVIAYSSRGGIMVHLVPSMTDAGDSRMATTTSLAIIFMTLPIGALVYGVLSDFLHVRLCLAAALLLFGVGILFFNLNPLSSVAPVKMMGFGLGGLTCLVTVVLADYFGRGLLGTLRCFLGIFIVGSYMIGAYLLGYIWDITKSYSTGFVGIGIGLLICALLAVFMWPPRYEKLLIS